MLCESQAVIRGSLELLWDVAYECGNPVIGDESDIELAADWKGEPGKLFRVLLECGGVGKAGFIEPIPGEPGRYQVHDLYDHAPEYVRKRLDREEARRKRGITLRETRSNAARIAAAARWGKDASGMRSDTLCLPRGTTPAPAPAPKEDSSEEESCSEPSQAPASDSPVMEFPTVGKGPKAWGLTSTKLAEYRISFPGVDIESECRKARQWCIDNAARRKTAKGMPAFLGRWLAKVQDGPKAGVNSNGRVNQQPQAPKPRKVMA
jgi:hypothetical protein